MTPDGIVKEETLDKLKEQLEEIIDKKAKETEKEDIKRQIDELTKVDRFSWIKSKRVMDTAKFLTTVIKYVVSAVKMIVLAIHEVYKALMEESADAKK